MSALRLTGMGAACVGAMPPHPRRIFGKMKQKVAR